MVAATAELTGGETGLITQSQSGSTMSVYDKVDPFVFIEKMGRIFGMTGAGGADTVEKGQLLALACLSRKMDIFQLGDTYHLIKGKLSMKSDTMLAKFRKLGGRHKWIKDGTDKQEAVIEVTYEGNTTTIKYTIEDARIAGLLATDPKKPGNWEKNTPAMLRARASSIAVRMVAPEILDGSYTTEELEGGDDLPPVQATVIPAGESTAATAEPEKQPRKRRTAAEIAEATANKTQTAEQPQATTQATAATSTAVVEPAREEMIDATFTTPQGQQAEQAASQPQQQPDQQATTAVTTEPAATKETLHKISNVAVRLGATQADIENQLRQKDPAFPGLEQISESKAILLLEQLTRIAVQAGK